MNNERPDMIDSLDPRIRGALAELKGMIVEQYPSASFDVSRSQDEPENVHLRAIVDLDDADQVLDLVSERLLQLQVEERLPVHVITLRTPERILASMQTEGA